MSGVEFWSPGRNRWIADLADATDRDLECAGAQMQHTMHLGKRVWDREPVAPLWVLDRPVVKQGEKPPTRLAQITRRITRQDQPGLVYHEAQHLKFRGGRWVVVNPAVITGPARIAAIWGELPTHTEYMDTRKRVRLAAQLGTYITEELPEGYR